MKNRMRVCALALAAVLCLSLLPVTAQAEGEAPTAQNLELTTYRGVSVAGKLEAEDPDGLDISFEITTEPVKGSVELSEDGSFVYTPKEGKKGRDYFGYRAVNSDGLSSQEATVIIRIEKQKTSLTYSDMEGNGAEYAAVLLAEQGVFTGKCVGGEYVFEPDEEVSRAELLAMCMRLGDAELLSGVMSTGFSDDADIPAWAKPYVATALMEGYISGYSEDGRAVFNANSTATLAEAAVMLGGITGLSDTVTVVGSVDESVPAWAASQATGLVSRGLIDAGDDLSGGLTRAECAELLADVIEYTSED